MVSGFSINANGKRVPCKYGSDQERAWCECQELLKAKYYKEAYKKLDEYHDINGGFVGQNDWMVILKVEVGYLNVKPTKPNFDSAKQAWNKCLYSDTSDSDDLIEIAREIIDIFAEKNKILSLDDFSDVNVKGTAKILDFMLFFLEAGDDQGFDYLRESDLLHMFSDGIRNLLANGDKKKANKYFKSVEKLSYYGDYFTKENNPFQDDAREGSW